MAGIRSIREYYKDMRQCRRPGSNSMAFALVTQLPFPNGVVSQAVRSAFLEASTTQRADEIANVCANGPAIDSLVILLRLALALSLSPEKSGDPRLYDLAYHDFGRNLVDDYMVKGELFDLLYPPQTDQFKHATGSDKATDTFNRVDETLGELISHPLVSAALWSHPFMQFFRRDTWIRKPGQVGFKPYELDRKFVLRNLPFHIDDHAAPTDLGKYFSQRLGIRDIDGASIAFAGYMPEIIPVIMRGGQDFNSIRAFTIDGPDNYRRRRDGTLAPQMATRHYHLRAVLNLAESDIRIHHQDTSPVVEQLLKRKGKEWVDTDHGQKLTRGEHARGWTFEDSPTRHFLLIYARYYDPNHAPYRLPSRRFGEYIPPVRGNGEQRLAARPYVHIKNKPSPQKIFF
ncbi:hypothetical protein C8A01DRAFT_44997 [Parachaetomium inaequale]|uniref:Uncharacterized protein n=1 Tax=Parachaetomium inaequale TaxID=2588326 RepID=A0AAN6PKR6_9PEZI|nr:hypothetical protein C8A01DRAFT_44997 [Parachaetomium inaequale]